MGKTSLFSRMTNYSRFSLQGMAVAWSTCSPLAIRRAEWSSGTLSTIGIYWKIFTHTWMLLPIIPEHSQMLDTSMTTTPRRYAYHVETPYGQDLTGHTRSGISRDKTGSDTAIS